MDYWIVNVGARADIEANTVDIYVDGLQNLSLHVPTRKENLFEMIKTGKADWSTVNHTITGMRLRANFNTEKLHGPYVFTTETDLFADEDAFIEWFDTDPRGAFKLIKERAEKV